MRQVLRAAAAVVRRREGELGAESESGYQSARNSRISPFPATRRNSGKYGPRFSIARLLVVTHEWIPFQAPSLYDL